MEGDLGKNFWWKTVGLVIGCGILILLSWFVISGLVFRFGLMAALIIVFGIAIIFSHRWEKKNARRYVDNP